MDMLCYMVNSPSYFQNAVCVDEQLECMKVTE